MPYSRKNSPYLIDHHAISNVYFDPEMQLLIEYHTELGQEPTITSADKRQIQQMQKEIFNIFQGYWLAHLIKQATLSQRSS